jgi:hypothetical protein
VFLIVNLKGLIKEEKNKLKNRRRKVLFLILRGYSGLTEKSCWKKMGKTP